ncbi:MAG: gluconokinase [Bacteroidota bacterium]
MANSVFYIMGVSGSGKSTVGKMLSATTGIPFFDGDDFHPAANIQKMASGQALNDDDRQGWLIDLNILAKKESLKNGAVIACSALKSAYRTTLKNGLENCFFIFLNGDFDTIKKRMEARGGHFMPSHLLESQFADLEFPGDAVVIDIENKPEEIISEIISQTHYKRKSAP